MLTSDHRARYEPLHDNDHECGGYFRCLPGHHRQRRGIGVHMKTTVFRNRESVIRAIVRREREGLPLSSRAVQVASSQLHSGAYRHFGSWRNALQAAGIKATKVEKRRQWDKAEIIAHLRNLCGRGRSLRQKFVHRNDSGLHRAACQHFGTWCNALIAAGINPEAICRDPQWDRARIIEAILLRVVQGTALGSTTVRPHTLKSAAIKEFGSWPGRWLRPE